MYPFRSFTNEEIINVKSYKFSTQNEPILYRLFVQRLFDYVQTFIPQDVMPNQITWIGYLSMMVGLLLTVFFDPALVNPPKYLPLANSILLLVYFSADFLDGVHARKTKQCSQLGALLDHGVDSVVTLSVLISICSSLRTGISEQLVFLGYLFLSGFYFVGLFIKYVGYMKLSIISGQSEGLLCVMLIHMVSYLRPALLESIKKVRSWRLVQRYRNKLMVALAGVATVVSFFDLFYHINTESPIARNLDALMSTMKLFAILSFLLLVIFSNIRSSILDFYLFMGVLSQCFTICYVEETVSSMATSETDIKVFVFSYLFLGLLSASYIVRQNSPVTVIIFILSTVHFLIRVGSILVDLSVKLDCRLFTRAF